MNQPALFDMPLAKPRRPSEPILRAADWGKGGTKSRYRFALHRAWGQGPCICWVGLNPSTADHIQDDPTIIREMTFSLAWGFGSMVKFNIYPFRSSTVPAMRAWLRHRDEDELVRYAIIDNFYKAADYAPKFEMFVAAWGNNPADEDVKNFMDEVEAGLIDDKLIIDDPNYKPPTVTWHCLGKTASGNPIHPLARGLHRVADDTKPLVWRQG